MTQIKEASITSCSSLGGSGTSPSVRITLDAPDCKFLKEKNCTLWGHQGTQCILYDHRVLGCYFAND